ncbi:MAG TPA: ATP-binding protein [Vicinamibacterales bacterium]|jgi:heavy metal sensor kinase
MIDSIRSKLTAWYVSVLASVLIVFGVGIYVTLSNVLYERIDDGLRTLIDIATSSLTHEAGEGQSPREAAASTVSDPYGEDQSVAIYTSGGALLADSLTERALANSQEQEPLTGDAPTLTVPILDVMTDRRPHLDTVEANADHGAYRRAMRRVQIGADDYIIVAGQSLGRVEEDLALLRSILLYTIPAAVAVAGIGGWFLARKSLSPVVAMAERAAEMGAGNLGGRLPVVNKKDELGQLAGTFNALFGRLETAFAQQRQFMADASHELRTPIATARTAASVTLQQPNRSETEYRDALRIVDDSTRRLTRLVDDMFTLARADAGQYPLQRGTFYLDELAAEVGRAGSVLGARKNVTVEVSAPSSMAFLGDEDLLRRMLLNLVDNAIRHTANGSLVKLTLTETQGEYVVTVSDMGAGIPLEAQPHIFERFYRTDTARTRTPTGEGGGAGLGLAIARWVANAHDGRLELVKSDERGTVLRATFPVTAPEDQEQLGNVRSGEIQDQESKRSRASSVRAHQMSSDGVVRRK